MFNIKALLLSLCLLGASSAIANEEGNEAVNTIAMPCIYPPPVWAQPWLQKTYITHDRIVITDHAIFYIDYDGCVRTTPGVFVDEGGIYVFATENMIRPMPMAQ